MVTKKTSSIRPVKRVTMHFVTDLSSAQIQVPFARSSFDRNFNDLMKAMKMSRAEFTNLTRKYFTEMCPDDRARQIESQERLLNAVGRGKLTTYNLQLALRVCGQRIEDSTLTVAAINADSDREEQLEDRVYMRELRGLIKELLHRYSQGQPNEIDAKLKVSGLNLVDKFDNSSSFHIHIHPEGNKDKTAPYILKVKRFKNAKNTKTVDIKTLQTKSLSFNKRCDLAKAQGRSEFMVAFDEWLKKIIN